MLFTYAVSLVETESTIYYGVFDSTKFMIRLQEVKKSSPCSLNDDGWLDGWMERVRAVLRSLFLHVLLVHIPNDLPPLPEWLTTHTLSLENHRPTPICLRKKERIISRVTPFSSTFVSLEDVLKTLSTIRSLVKTETERLLSLNTHSPKQNTMEIVFSIARLPFRLSLTSARYSTYINFPK
jgi:hypothetical protein